MSFEIQELSDIIRVIVLLNLKKDAPMPKGAIKTRIDSVCVGYACVEVTDVEKSLNEMAAEGLIKISGESVELSAEGARLGREWQSLLLKKDPVLEVVAGLVDGSITGLVVIISAFLATLSLKAITFAAILTLSAVSVTNFSSFLLGGITEDLADMITLETLMNYSLSDIPHKEEREKSLMLLKRLFMVLHRQISRANIYAAVVCGSTTFLAGLVPISTFLILPDPFNIIVSLTLVAAITGVFLVRYRSRKTKVHWKVTLVQTVVIVVISTVISLIVGGIG